MYGNFDLLFVWIISFSMRLSLVFKLSNAFSAYGIPLSSTCSWYKNGDLIFKSDGTVLVVKLFTIAKAPKNCELFNKES